MQMGKNWCGWSSALNTASGTQLVGSSEMIR